MIASCPDDHELQLEGYVYHALNRAVGRSTIVEKVDDYAAFEAVLEEAREQVDMRLIAFCVMPNHWHLAHGTFGTGPLYQGRFKSFPIQEDEHFELVAPSQPERPGWHSLRRNGLAAGHGEASGIAVHVTSPWPPKTPPSRAVNRRTTRFNLRRPKRLNPDRRDPPVGRNRLLFAIWYFRKVKQQANAFLDQRKLIGWQFTQLSDQFGSRVSPNPLGVEGTAREPSDA